MADKSFRCRLITPESRVFDEPATYVSIPLHDGMAGILPNRAPFVAKLGLGELKITFEKGGGSRSYLLEDGFGQMVGDSLTILAQRAVPAEEIVVVDARAELAEAEARVGGTGEEMRKVVRDRDRARLALRLAETARTSGI